MSATQSKAQRREMKKAFGPEIADALADLRSQVTTVGMNQRVVAREVHDIERSVAAVREARTHDARQHGARVDGLQEAVQTFEKSLSNEIGREHNARVELEQRVFAIEQWIYRRQRLTRWQRLVSFVTGQCMAPFPGEPAAGAAKLQPAVYESFNGGPLTRIVAPMDARLGAEGGE